MSLPARDLRYIITSKMLVRCTEHQYAFFYKTPIVIYPCRVIPCVKTNDISRILSKNWYLENVIKKMRGFAYSLIPWVILNSTSRSMIDSLLNGKLNVQVSLDITMLIIVLIVLALVYIFQYGAMLQQESDETL